MLKPKRDMRNHRLRHDLSEAHAILLYMQKSQRFFAKKKACFSIRNENLADFVLLPT